MSDPNAETPKNGTPRLAPQTDKFQLAILVTRLEAQIEALKEQVDCLNESDERQDNEIRALEANIADLTKKHTELLTTIKTWRDDSTAADKNHSSRLQAIERRISGFGSLLVLLQIAIEAYKAGHGH